MKIKAEEIVEFIKVQRSLEVWHRTASTYGVWYVRLNDARIYEGAILEDAFERAIAENPSL